MISLELLSSSTSLLVQLYLISDEKQIYWTKKEPAAPNLPVLRLEGEVPDTFIDRDTLRLFDPAEDIFTLLRQDRVLPAEGIHNNADPAHRVFLREECLQLIPDSVRKLVSFVLFGLSKLQHLIPIFQN